MLLASQTTTESSAEETSRIAELRRYDILDTVPDPSFDRIVALATDLFKTPIALVSLIDESRQWFKARVGLDACETPREHAFCDHAIRQPEVMVVQDASLDARFCSNPLVTGPPHIRFYAGAPLVMPSGHCLGTLCIIDSEPRRFSKEHRRVLKDLSALVVEALESHLKSREIARFAEVLKVSQAELARSNSDLEQFASVAAHDLRAPLCNILGFAELLELRLGARLDEECAEYLQYIASGATQMHSMIDSLLHYSLVGASNEEFDETDLDEALSGALENLNSKIAEAGARITRDPLPKVKGGHDLLIQLFQNLVGNAVKFRRPKTEPKIHISAERLDREWRIGVADDGIGIDPKDASRIFKMLERLHGAGDFEGCGIGLTFCKKIVALHGGEIWLDTNYKKGARFYFTLPVLSGAEKAA